MCGILWETALRDKRANDSWEIFKDISLKVHELSILTCKKLDRGGRRLAWLSQELLAKMKHKTKMNRQGKQGCSPDNIKGTWLRRAERGLGKLRHRCR